MSFAWHCGTRELTTAHLTSRKQNMSKTLRTLAAAALVAAGAPQMASAALLTTTLDFEGATTLTLPTDYDDSQHGHTKFTGGNGAVTQFATGHNGTATNVLFNNCQTNCANSSIDFTVGSFNGATTPGFEGTFDFWMLKSGGTGLLNIVASTATGGQNITQTLGGAGDNGVWQHIFVTLDPLQKYVSVKFTVAPQQFLFDDISFQFEASAPPPGVPEPASVALVALALVGAASATRRRKP
jgi:PEP-CTERM motif